MDAAIWLLTLIHNLQHCMRMFEGAAKAPSSPPTAYLDNPALEQKHATLTLKVTKLQKRFLLTTLQSANPSLPPPIGPSCPPGLWHQPPPSLALLKQTWAKVTSRKPWKPFTTTNTPIISPKCDRTPISTRDCTPISTDTASCSLHDPINTVLAK